MKKHSVIINATTLLSKPTGIGKYSFEISKRLLNSEKELDFTFYYGYFSKDLYLPHAQSSGRLAKDITRILGGNYVFKKIAQISKLMILKFLSQEFDLYWEPAITPIQNIKSKHLIATVHDFSFHLHPEWHQKENRQYIEKYFWKNIRSADRIITGSYYTKKEIIEFLGFEPDKVHVIYHGVDHNNFRVHDRNIVHDFAYSYKLPKKFILFVGSIEPRKNLKNALLAYKSLPQNYKKEFKFLLAGFSGWNNAEVMNLIEQEKENIVYLGYLSNLELAYLYNLADVFIYPSLYEGFGLPPLEAMACGTPVIVSNLASIPEVCGESVYYVDAYDVASIAEGIYKIATDEAMRNDMVKKGLERVKLFNWDKSAIEHLAVFHEVLNH